jgi:hypothetical protein
LSKTVAGSIRDIGTFGTGHPSVAAALWHVAVSGTFDL